MPPERSAGGPPDRTYTGAVNQLESEPLDIRQYLRLFRRRGWILLLCVALIPLGTYLYTERLAEVYQSSAILQIQSSAAETPLIAGQEFAAPAQNIQAVARFVTTSAVSDAAARELGEPKGSLYGAATATADEITGFITITAQGPSAKRAQDVADAFASALGATRARRAKRRVDDAIEAVQQDLAALGNGPADAAARQELSQQLRRLRTLRSAQSQNAQVLEPALPGVKVAPNPTRNATVALILAFLLGVGLMLLAERADRRVRKADELERLAGVPLLGTIPRPAFPGGQPNPQTAEAFQTLRDSVTYFNVDEDLKSLVVISALKGEGKTTVATHLAVAYARAGKKVILVDADLRKPEVAERIGVDGSVGLSQVLVGAKLSDALREVPVFGERLRVLAGGPVPPNPSELMGSKRMGSLVSALSKSADIVIFDTPPLLMVSDAFPLLDKVSGVLALARIDQATRDAVRRMLEVASTAGGRVLGMVATGATGRGEYGYGYGYGYGDGQEMAGGQAARFEDRLGKVPAKRKPAAAPPLAAPVLPEPPVPETATVPAEDERPPEEEGRADEERAADEEERPVSGHAGTELTLVAQPGRSASQAAPAENGTGPPPVPEAAVFDPIGPPPVPGTADSPVPASTQAASADLDPARPRRRLFRRK